MMKKTGYTAYCVGDKFDKKLGGDGAILEINNNLCQCVIGLHNISKRELRAVEKGKITVTLTQVEDIIFFCLNIDDVLTFDVPFNMGLYNEFQLEDPGKYGYTMLIFLIDNATNRIKAMHAVGFKNKFSRKLYELSKIQWEHKLENYDVKLNRINFFVSTAELLKYQVACNIFGDGKVEEM